MKDILCKFFGFFKYILLVVAFGLVFYCINVTYARLEKPLSDAINVFIPFGFVLLMFIITLIVKSKSVGKNLLFNFVSVFVFLITIVVCLRSIFDTNMILYHRYGINFNPAYFSDNLSMIESMLYMIGGANVVLLICDIINKKPKAKKVVSEDNNKVEKDDGKKNGKKDNEKPVKKSESKDDEKDEE